MSAVEVLPPLDPLSQEHSQLEEVSEAPPLVVPETFPLPSKEDTLILFDWDDTLIPTTFLFSQQPGSLAESFEMPLKLQETLDEVAVSALATLEAAKQYGHVVIVTNSENGWVDLATQRFFPRLTEVLRDVPKFSARSAFESGECATPVHWKTLAFEHSITNFFGTMPRIRNVVSLGDSEHDRAALFLAAQKIPSCWAKSLKLTEQPDAEYILKEQELIRESLPQLAYHQGTLDLCIHCHARTGSPPGLGGGAAETSATG